MQVHHVTLLKHAAINAGCIEFESLQIHILLSTLTTNRDVT